MDVFSLVASLTLDSSGYDKGLGNAGKSASSFGEKLKSGLATAGKVAGAAIAAVGAAATATGAALAKGVSTVAVYGDNIDKMSQKMGMSAEAYQEWDAIMQHSGTSIESLQAGMKTLANAVESGNDAFERLGITEEDIASMNNEQLFSATISALQNVENETERTYLAGQLLGRGATELGALLNTSAEDTEAMRRRVHELGGVMSDEAVKAAAAYQDSLQDMQTAFSGLSRGLLTEFLPGVTTVMDGLAEIFTGNGDSGIGMISQGIDNVVSGISAKLPRIVSVGSQIILSLGDAIISNLEPLLSAASTVVITLASGLIEQAPMIVETGLSVIVSLAEGISSALPELIPTIVDVVLQIVDILTDPETLGTLVDASIAIIIALAEGLIEALPRLLEKAPVIIGNLVTAVIENAPKLLKAALELVLKLAEGIFKNLSKIYEKGKEIVNKLIDGAKEVFSKLVDIGKDIIGKVVEGAKQIWTDITNLGRNIVEGVWEGISGAATWLWEKVTGFFGGIVDGVKDFLGIHSPSTVFAGIGKNMAAGLGEGWDSEFDSIKKDIDSSLDFGTRTVDFAASGIGMSSAALVNGISGAARETGAGGTYVINLMLPDGTQFARYLLPNLIDVAKSSGTPIANPV